MTKTRLFVIMNRKAYIAQPCMLFNKYFSDYFRFVRDIQCMVEYNRISCTYFDLTMEYQYILNWNIISHFTSSLSTECISFKLRQGTNCGTIYSGAVIFPNFKRTSHYI